MGKVRKHLIIRGWVQGVFFRSTLQERAYQRGVKGWVRNNHDGSVEAVLEGDEEAVTMLISWCYRGPRGARVDKVYISDEPYTGEFSSFSIKYHEW
ncbi:MAG: acylphosphatase [Spirochaetota bacterium]